MALRQRLNKLEQAIGTGIELPVLLIRFVEPTGNGPSIGEIKLASLPGINLGIIHREEDEFEAAFVRRIYAMKVNGKPANEMTDEDLKKVMAADDGLAYGLATPGDILEGSLERVATGSID